MAHTDSPRADASPTYAADTAQTTEELRRFRRLLTQGRLGTHDYAVFLGLADGRMPDLVREVRQGFPFGAFERLRRNTSWEADFLAALVDIPRRTLSRRKQEGRFHADESDRLLRVSRIFGRAVQLFEGDSNAASAWLERPLPALGNARPIDLAKTEIGALEVERVILALEHGVFV